MSASALAWALEQQGLPTEEKLLLVVLADIGDQDGAGHGGQPSIDYLSQSTGLATPALWAALTALSERGLIRLDLDGLALLMEEAAS